MVGVQYWTSSLQPRPPAAVQVLVLVLVLVSALALQAPVLVGCAKGGHALAASPQYTVTTLRSDAPAKQQGGVWVTVAVDPRYPNIIYAADKHAHVVRRWDVTAGDQPAVYAGAVGQNGSADGAREVARFNGPAGLCVDGNGHVYVADRLNSAVRLINTTSGMVLTVAGGRTGFHDGPGAEAAFSSGLAGVACLPSGAVLLGDEGNRALRMMTCVQDCQPLGPGPGPSPALPPSPAPAPQPSPAPTPGPGGDGGRTADAAAAWPRVWLGALVGFVVGMCAVALVPVAAAAGASMQHWGQRRIQLARARWAGNRRAAPHMEADEQGNPRQVLLLQGGEADSSTPLIDLP